MENLRATLRPWGPSTLGPPPRTEVTKCIFCGDVLRWTPETGQVAKRESSLGAAVWPKVRHDQYSEETQF
jgi:hypothetical protein